MAEKNLFAEKKTCSCFMCFHYKLQSAPVFPHSLGGGAEIERIAAPNFCATLCATMSSERLGTLSSDCLNASLPLSTLSHRRGVKCQVYL